MTELTLLPLELRHTAEHTLEGICVPYGVTSTKAGYPQGERFLAGSFAGVTASSKIRLTDIHDSTGKRPIGVATEFRDTPQGLLGTFRFYNTPQGRGAWKTWWRKPTAA